MQSGARFGTCFSNTLSLSLFSISNSPELNENKEDQCNIVPIMRHVRHDILESPENIHIVVDKL
jgi:hypothetical protein